MKAALAMIEMIDALAAQASRDRQFYIRLTSDECVDLRKLLKQAIELREALGNIIDVDTGDDPGLWKYEAEFSIAHAIYKETE